MAGEHTAEFRFHGELNDFLPPPARGRALPCRFNGSPAVKDPIEAQGVPHTEVELIVVNGESAGFGRRLQDGDRVEVYPASARVELEPRVALREAPPRAAFVLDVNLGKLAKRLRALGFDALYSNRYADAEVADIAAAEGRIALTRDRRLLHARRIAHGYWVRSTRPDEQVGEVLGRFDLRGEIRPFCRCLVCNGLLAPVPKAAVLDRLEPKTKLYYEAFFACGSCGKIYWEGSHLDSMRARWGSWLPA